MTPTLLNNRYCVLQTLASGGFGNTFLAEDSYMPSRRRCVIKQLKPLTHNPEVYQKVQERFQREAAVLEELGEGNSQIPRLYAYFSEGGQFYLVQEWIEGETLTKKVENKARVSEGEVREILLSLLPVLDYVHSRRIVHRDLKPDNIIIRQRDKLPILIDFGAVKEAMSTVVNSQGNSTQSMVIGTPGFMPSEQAAGRPTYASDLYSLGLTAVFLLTGKLPQELETDLRTGEILWRQHAPNLHSNLAMVLDQSIRSHQSDRFATAQAMLNALQSDASVSQIDTVAVSPKGSLPLRNPSTPPAQKPISGSGRTVPLNTSPNKKESGRQPIIIGSLLAAGLLITAVAVVLGLSRSPETSSPISASSEPISEAPLAVPSSSPTLPSEPEEPADQASLPDSSQPTEEPTNQFPAPDSSQLPEESTDQASLPNISQSPSDSFDRRPQTIPEQSSSSEPSLIPTPPRNNPNSNPSQKIPGFAPGTQKDSVEYALGNPTKASRGLWNTRALLYEEYVPNQVSLGYLFDPSSGRLRQSEATFSPSVGLETISQTLDQMLNNNASEDIEQGLEAVYQGQARKYEFTSGRGGRLRGVIQRNDQNRIYIAVWEADLK
ncbi:protein kinase domain-containing protein [Lyngbya aestuarii]|uniref:protein kinase domain-containing protein n=1 Tax=Lyngbya aestuarii TaxID=118322 RepID=UPI00403D808E